MDNRIFKRRVRYNNEEDRRKAYLATQLRYATKIWQCEICMVALLRGNKTCHLKSKTHANNKNKYDIQLLENNEL